jgi:hypothetical protein
MDVDRELWGPDSPASIENILINYNLLYLLASAGPSESAQRADTMLISL